jgi:uncharacterized protein (DUF58 family)
MTAGLMSFLRQRWQAWWDARLPRVDQLTLTHRNLYILPTRMGWSFAAITLILLGASINDRINLGYALTFWLVGSALAATHLTHGNLQGLQLRLLSTRGVHAGSVVQVGIGLHNPHPKKGRWGLRAQAQAGLVQQVDVGPGQDTLIELDVPAPQRGWLTLPRITLETGYPLGLFRAWAYWRPLMRVLIWPAIDPHAPPLPAWQADATLSASTRQSGHSTEPPDGLRDYRRGDPVRWIAWKKSSHAIASGTGLVSRTSEQGRSPDLWLDYEQSPSLAGLSPEARLSRLATWLLQAESDAESTGSTYGLRLPGQIIPCGRGPAHLRECLDTLARWPGKGSVKT